MVTHRLAQMHKLNKWTKQNRDVQVGDVVAVLEDKVRGVWPIGVIEETFQNKKDGHVRRALVRCNGKIYDRALNRLMVIQEVSTSSHK